ncbi:MAG: hypothetical protein PHF00_11425 [Elusimicrobia bacterium]|nr:hypothetical protein [Elusimicrobiota bacterium]
MPEDSFPARAVAAALLLLASACAPGPRIDSDPWFDAAKIKRVGILPFSGFGARGRRTADEVGAGLAKLGLTPVDSENLKTALDKLGPGRQDKLDLASLNEIWQATRADALVIGARDRRWLSLLLVDAQTGDVLVNARLPARRATEADLARSAVDALAGPLGKGGAKPLPVESEPDPSLPAL